MNLTHLIEIRTLTLKPGRREEFQRLYIEQALAFLKQWNFDVVAHGPSLHNKNTYYVLRRFDISRNAIKWRMPIMPATIGERARVKQFWL